MSSVTPSLSSWGGIYSLHQQIQPLGEVPNKISEIRIIRCTTCGSSALRSTHSNGYFRRINCTEMTVEKGADHPPAGNRIIRSQGFQSRAKHVLWKSSSALYKSERPYSGSSDSPIGPSDSQLRKCEAKTCVLVLFNRRIEIGSSVLRFIRFSERSIRFSTEEKRGENTCSGFIQPPYINRIVRIAVHPIHRSEHPITGLNNWNFQIWFEFKFKCMHDPKLIHMAQEHAIKLLVMIPLNSTAFNL